MRILILVSSDLYVRSFLRSGAFDELADSNEVLWLSRDGLSFAEDVASRPGFVGTIPSDERRSRAYDLLRVMYMMARRRRVRSMAIRLSVMPRRGRIKVWLYSLPGVSRIVRSVILRRLGPNLPLRRALKDAAPDLVIAPTAGTDPEVHDLVCEAAELGIPSLLLFNGWDNISSKTWFIRLPDYIGVWGDQCVDHAVAIHGFQRERVFALGVPTFRQHFEMSGRDLPSPYPFPYVLFAGCALPFDERSALAALDAELGRSGPEDVRIVYRPHPWRHPRAVDDGVGLDDFRSVVIDQQVQAQYLAAQGRGASLGPEDFLPSLDYYPALLSNAELVVCPLSTMVVESAILERPVLILAYDDRVHKLPPSVVAESDHFDGIDEIDGFEVADRLEDVGPTLSEMLRRSTDARTPMQPQLQRWLFFDDRTYGRRLADLIASLPVSVSPPDAR